jgi:hypothetical protein
MSPPTRPLLVPAWARLRGPAEGGLVWAQREAQEGGGRP